MIWGSLTALGLNRPAGQTYNTGNRLQVVRFYIDGMDEVRDRMMRFCRPVLVWLALVVVAAGAPGIVLCAGAHGHVAIEPAGHYHGLTTSHKHEKPSIPHDPTDTSIMCNHEHSEPCVDIPLFWEPVTGGDILKTITTNFVVPVGQSSPLSEDLHDFGKGGPYIPPPAYYGPLSNIILLV